MWPVPERWLGRAWGSGNRTGDRSQLPEPLKDFTSCDLVCVSRRGGGPWIGNEGPGWAGLEGERPAGRLLPQGGLETLTRGQGDRCQVLQVSRKWGPEVLLSCWVRREDIQGLEGVWVDGAAFPEDRNGKRSHMWVLGGDKLRCPWDIPWDWTGQGISGLSCSCEVSHHHRITK